MKINKIIGLFIGLMILMVSGCDPIVDEKSLENITDAESVELIATQSTPGGNEITFEMITPGITGYWDYMIGKGLTDRVTVIFPVKGSFDFKYVGTLGAEFFEKTVPVTITALDKPVSPLWTALLGADPVSGKTWVYAGGPAPDGKKWWFMSPPNDPASWNTAWWNAAGDCCPPSDATGSMKFDLDGAANFTYTKEPGAAPVKGSFVLNTDNNTLKINDANLMGNEGCAANSSNNYTIISLTEDEMILYMPNAAGCGTGWTWIFKPQEDL
jgi:hypothetical protein